MVLPILSKGKQKKKYCCNNNDGDGIVLVTVVYTKKCMYALYSTTATTACSSILSLPHGVVSCKSDCGQQPSSVYLASRNIYSAGLLFCDRMNADCVFHNTGYQR